MSKPSPYKRLPGIGRHIATFTRLYLASDHILQVSTAAYTERYKRFYFRDIQALIVVRTQSWIWWTAAFGGAGLLAAFVALLAEDFVATWVFSVIAGLLVAGALASGLRGPSCRCHVRTAIQTERLPSLNRVRRTEKVLSTLKIQIDALQGLIADVSGPEGGQAAEPDETMKSPEEPTQSSPT